MEVSAPLASLQAFLDSAFTFVSEDPVLRGIQALLACGAFTLVFLVFFVTRDILLRSRSLLLQLGCVLLVALLPVVGFLLYLLVRPARTVREREMQARLERMEELLQHRERDVALSESLPALSIAKNFEKRPVKEEGSELAFSLAAP